MKYFLPLLLLSQLAHANYVSVCTMGGYNYTGTFFSSEYNMIESKALTSCHARIAHEESVTKETWEKLLKEIDDLIAGMMTAEGCEGVRPILTNYQAHLRELREKFKARVVTDQAHLQDYFKQHDVQRRAAFVSAYSATCNAGHHRTESFIDLDFINHLLPESVVTQIKLDGQNAQSCADVQAFGSTDLSGFEINMKNALDGDVLLNWDSYGIPDRLEVVDNSGTVLYDSGCKSLLLEPPVKIPMKSISVAKKLKITITKNCEDTSKERAQGPSAWEFRLRCQEAPGSGSCFDQKEQLIMKVKQKIEQAKTLMDEMANAQYCFGYLDKDLLTFLEKGKFIVPGNRPLFNGTCGVMDVGCLGDRESNMRNDRPRSSP